MQADERFMKLAIAKAREGVNRGQSPFGACIVKNGEIVSCEHNAVWANTDSTAHAEICAIRKACERLDTIDLSGCVIYSTCEPCPMCFSACHWAKISSIVFGARIADARDAGFSELSISNEQMKESGRSQVEILSDFMRAENIRLFTDWARAENRGVY